MEKTIYISQRGTLKTDEFRAPERTKRNNSKEYFDTLLVDNTSGYVILENARNNKKAASLLHEEEEEKVYAEEVYDEGEDFRDLDLMDREVENEKRLSYLEISDLVKEALNQNGIEGEKVALDLLASMSFSRLINIEKNAMSDDFVDILFQSINNPHFFVEYDPVNNIASSSMTLEILNYAKENPFKAVFVYVRNADATEFFKYMRPFFSYIDNPNGDVFITTQNKSLYVPHNLYFIVALERNTSFYTIHHRLLKHIGTLDSKIDYKANYNPLASQEIDLRQLMRASRDANDVFMVSESSWKKLDKFIASLANATKYVLDNKVMRRIEEYTVVYLSTGENELIAFDRALARNLMHDLLVVPSKDSYKGINITKELSNQFGVSNMSETKEAIEKYLKLLGGE